MSEDGLAQYFLEVIGVIGLAFLIVVAYLFSIFGVTSTTLGVCVFLSVGTTSLTYLIIRRKMKKLQEKREKAVAWELKDQLKELRERLGRGVITQEEYEQKKKLLEKSK